ncbi:MAG: L-lactate dehydrogenase complex protein LldG [Paracoccaceae bacterium]|jgi:L-lactate dehydrogenase complex protein LldG
MTARDDILGRIRKAIDRPEGAGPPPAPEYANQSLIPGRARGTPTELTERFIAMATEVEISINRVSDAGEVGRAIAGWLNAEGLPDRAVISPDPVMDAYGWEKVPGLSIRRGATHGDDLVSVTPTIAGIAETGSIMVTAGPGTPYTLNFLPETHIAIVHADRIVGGYEDAWAQVRRNGETGVALPRTVTIITGPSRSSDIERTVTVGVHGPKRLHIVLVGDTGDEADGENA